MCPRYSDVVLDTVSTTAIASICMCVIPLKRVLQVYAEVNLFCAQRRNKPRPQPARRVAIGASYFQLDASNRQLIRNVVLALNIQSSADP